ncbi:tetratricopeptide repeat protein [Pelomyxa schiedti]|nr:tetratricopeptide repeat protein [Pelomyxa schiedti]
MGASKSRCNSAVEEEEQQLNERVAAGDTSAMFELSQRYLSGWWRPPAPTETTGTTAQTTGECTTKGLTLLTQAAGGGHAEAMCLLAELHRDGRCGLARDLDRACALYERAGNGNRMWYVGWLFYRGGGAETCDVEKAVAVWKRAADMGDDGAMAELGWCYQYGICVERDVEKAVALYNMAIASNERRHSWRLGVCHLLGEGVERDWGKAVELMQKSGNDVNATAHVAWCYLCGGCGVERDPVCAVALLKGCGSNRASVFLGFCHERGIGVDMDPSKARELFDEGKKYPDGAEALGEIAQFLWRGDCGVPTDRKAAVGYFQMGADGGDPISIAAALLSESQVEVPRTTGSG